jgi:nicotinate phosphoribosyltransferase
MKNNEQPLSAGLDFYKVTMGQVIHEYHPNTEVTFTLKNRATEQPLSEYVPAEALQQRLDTIREQGFTAEEVAYYAGLTAQNGDTRFTQSYLDHLEQLELPEVNIVINPQTKDLAIDSKGRWSDVTFWETVIMSETNEIYYKQLMESHGLQLEDLYNEGNRRLDEKIEKLRQYPDIKFSDFGTRRRFSADWHEHVVERLANELPEQFVGTSNPWFAYKYNLAPIGTYAHEMPMVYAGIADAFGKNPLEGHGQMLKDWEHKYKGDLSIALADTFGSEFFFNYFTPEQAKSWNGLRHDSGDPIVFGERVLEFYEKHGVDPTTKTIVFSDGLDVDTIIKLYEHFKGRINILFGWGTSLMNDLGLPANNMVMKATEVRVSAGVSMDGRDPIDYMYETNSAFTHVTRKLVKLSDNAGKHTGPENKVNEYQDWVEIANKLAKQGISRMVRLA